MIIRPFESDDKPQIVALMHEFGEYIESLDPLAQTHYSENGAEYFTDKLIREVTENTGRIFVAAEGTTLVGFIGGYIGTQDEEEQMEALPANPGVISEFFVTEALRGSGIGSQLLATMEDFLRSHGATLVRLGVFASNTIARDFYARQGYQDRIITVSKKLCF